MPNNNNNAKKHVELVWGGKYDRFEKGPKSPIGRPNLPFQTAETVNKPRIKGGAQVGLYPEDAYPANYPKDWKNALFWGDNKLVMSSLIKQGWAGKLNLIYIDPPFFTGADFTVRTTVGDEQIEKAPSIIEERAYRDTWSGGIASYLKYMYERLVLMRELLAENGTIWVHLGWQVAHYVKVMMDNDIFGQDNFRNELIVKRGQKNVQAQFDTMDSFASGHDLVLFYSKQPSTRFQILKAKLDEIKSGSWNNHWRGTDRPTMRYKLFGITPKSGQWRWSKERTTQAVENYNYYVKNYSTKMSIDQYYQYVLETAGEELDFVRLSSTGKPEHHVPPTEHQIINDVWIDISAYEGRKNYPTQKSEDLLFRIISGFSKPGDIVADFFCGSGTTLATAEKLGRRWLGSDLSKFAIQVTRKRLLDIHNSKDLQSDEGEKYGKPARPFELKNIGNYETVYWQEKVDEYLAFMLRLYGAQPMTGFRYIHGRKGNGAVHVGPLNAPVTMEEVEKVVVECRLHRFNKADVLGWEWSYEVNELAKALAKKNGVELRLIQIPSINEIKASLVGFDLQLLKVPEQVVEKELTKYVKFPELAYLEVETEVKKNVAALKIADFQLAPTAELAEISGKVRDSRELIDYWAIDWDYKGDTFHNQWQSFRLKSNPRVDYEAEHRYGQPGEYHIMVKAIDVFGNDTNKLLKARIK